MLLFLTYVQATLFTDFIFIILEKHPKKQLYFIFCRAKIVKISFKRKQFFIQLRREVVSQAIYARREKYLFLPTIVSCTKIFCRCLVHRNVHIVIPNCIVHQYLYAFVSYGNLSLFIPYAMRFTNFVHTVFCLCVLCIRMDTSCFHWDETRFSNTKLFSYVNV